MSDERSPLDAATEAGKYGQIYAIRHDWLAKAEPEDILDPDLPIMDTHQHFWDIGHRHYLLPDFLADTASGHNIIGSVFIECGSMYRAKGPVPLRAVGEVEFAAGIAAMCESGQYGGTMAASGIVGFVDLTLGDGAREPLEAMIRAGGGRFRGVRHAGNWHENPAIGNSHHLGTGSGLYGRDSFRKGLGVLTGLGLSLDAWVYFTQLGELTDLARACPDARIVANHTGGPLGYGPYTGRQDNVFPIWKAGMAELAKCPNVTMKLGGMLMRLAAFDYHVAERPVSSRELAELWGPWIRTAIELFGAERCTFESNYPVEKMGVTYAALWNAFKRVASGCSTSEKEALFSGTAKRFYRLG
jgi:L-fuconolactonase